MKTSSKDSQKFTQITSIARICVTAHVRPLLMKINSQKKRLPHHRCWVMMTMMDDGWSWDNQIQGWLDVAMTPTTTTSHRLLPPPSAKVLLHGNLWGNFILPKKTRPTLTATTVKTLLGNNIQSSLFFLESRQTSENNAKCASECD